MNVKFEDVRAALTSPHQEAPASPVAWRTFYGDKVAYSDGPDKPISNSMVWEPLGVFALPAGQEKV